MPKVLIVSYYYPPIAGGGVPRALKMSKYLPRYGWAPVVLTVDPEYNVALDPALLVQVPEGTPIYRAKEWNPYGRLNRLRVRHAEATTGKSGVQAHQRPRFITRVKQALFSFLKKVKNVLLIPDDQRFWIRNAVREGLKAIRAHDVQFIFSTSGPYSAHLVAKKLARKTGLPWIADYRDPWTQNMHRSGIAWREWMEGRMERSVMEQATAITTVTPTFAANFRAKYPHIKRMEVIYNGYDPEDFTAIETKADTRTRLTFAYTGIFYAERNPRLLLQAVSELLATGNLQKDEISLRFAGVFDYPGYTDNTDAVRAYGLEDVVEVLGFLPHQQALALLYSADVLLLINDTAPGSEAYIPGKLYEYLAIKRPILALSLAGEATHIIDRFQLGTVVPPTDIEQMKVALMELVRRWREGELGFSYPDSNDRAGLELYERDKQAGQLAALMDELK